MSSKYRDLRRDGRYALHTIPAGPENIELHLSGAARAVEGAAERAAVAAAAGRSLHDFEVPFELLLERATGTRWAHWPTVESWPSYTRWGAEP